MEALRRRDGAAEEDADSDDDHRRAAAPARTSRRVATGGAPAPLYASTVARNDAGASTSAAALCKSATARRCSSSCEASSSEAAIRASSASRCSGGSEPSASAASSATPGRRSRPRPGSSTSHPNGNAEFRGAGSRVAGRALHTWEDTGGALYIPAESHNQMSCDRLGNRRARPVSSVGGEHSTEGTNR